MSVIFSFCILLIVDGFIFCSHILFCFFSFRFSPLHPSKYPSPNFLEQAKSALVEHQHTIQWNEIPNQLESMGRVSLFPCCNKSKKFFLFEF